MAGWIGLLLGAGFKRGKDVDGCCWSGMSRRACVEFVPCEGAQCKTLVHVKEIP
jgi:hypothetical protein